MSEHRQSFAVVHVAAPTRYLGASLVRNVVLNDDGTKIVSRRPRCIEIESGGPAGRKYRLDAERAYMLGQALIDASAVMEDELIDREEVDDADRL